MSSVRPQGERCPGGAGASANIINVTTTKQAERFGLTRGRGAAGWTTTSRRQRKHRRLCSGRTNEAGGHKLQEPRTCSRANSATAIPQPQPAAAAANAAKARESEAWRAIHGCSAASKSPPARCGLITEEGRGERAYHLKPHRYTPLPIARAATRCLLWHFEELEMHQRLLGTIQQKNAMAPAV